MKIAITLSIVLVALCAIGGLVYMVWPSTEVPTNITSGQQYPTGSYQSSVTIPGSQSTTTTPVLTMEVFDADGKSLQVNDVTKGEGVTEDAANPGIYYLAGASPTEETYSISYISEDTSFTVSILSEPLGEIRLRAEKDLLVRLGISENDACRLRYEVLVPYSVNPLYAGKNLGFSFCPGAEIL